MNVESRTEAAQFTFWEYFIRFSVQCLFSGWQLLFCDSGATGVLSAHAHHSLTMYVNHPFFYCRMG
jgi:hypothetical protein